MTKFLKITAAVALVSVAAASFASAGLNSGATAQMYWQTPNTGAAIAARDNILPQCQLVVTAKGLTNFAGCDVQLLINALDGGAYPISERGGKAEKIRAHDGNAGAVLLEHQRAHGQVAFASRGRVAGPHAAAQRQERVGIDFADGNAGAECRARIEFGDSEQKQQWEKFHFHGSVALSRKRLARCLFQTQG